MKVKLITKRNDNTVLGFAKYSLKEDDNTYDINPEDIYIGFSYIDESGSFVSNKEAYDLAMAEQEKQAKKETLRAKREPLLAAFDKYKSNVYYGIESETLAERESIMAWYKAVLELDADALENVPAKIKYYV